MQIVIVTTTTAAAIKCTLGKMALMCVNTEPNDKHPLALQQESGSYNTTRTDTREQSLVPSPHMGVCTSGSARARVEEGCTLPYATAGSIEHTCTHGTHSYWSANSCFTCAAMKRLHHGSSTEVCFIVYKHH